jgi:Ca2+-binding EF-hand superfamily protein
MEKLGHKVSEKDIKEIMEQHDIGKDGFLTFDEFKIIFINDKQI